MGLRVGLTMEWACASGSLHLQELSTMSAHPWHDVPLSDDIAVWFPAFIEIPSGSKVKYELDKLTGLLRVDRVLFSAVHYPANYGFIPQTYCPDNDPLDVLVLGQDSVVPAVLLRARAIGVMRMYDNKAEDDKIIAVHVDDPDYNIYRSIDDLPSHRLRELQRFFLDYKVLEGKEVEVETPRGVDDAMKTIREAVALYARERDRLRFGAQKH
jgi:inorganic pyrophosphatase